MNLALNARDAMPAGGRITLTSANIEVQDGAARAPAFRLATCPRS